MLLEVDVLRATGADEIVSEVVGVVLMLKANASKVILSRLIEQIEGTGVTIEPF
jgi:hypothetical protein